MSGLRGACAAWRGLFAEIGLCVVLVRCYWALSRWERLQRRCAQAEARAQALLRRVEAQPAPQGAAGFRARMGAA